MRSISCNLLLVVECKKPRILLLAGDLYLSRIPAAVSWYGRLLLLLRWTRSTEARLPLSALKKDFLLPSNIVANADVSRLINSSEVQAVGRPAKGGARTKRTNVQKKNALRNRQILLRLNPYAAAFSKDKLGQSKVKEGKGERAGQNFEDTMMTE